jgi:DNA-binding NtrC family response regulator
MLRPRVFLLEDEAVLVSILLQFFELEGIEATPCSSTMELQQRIAQDPERVVVADAWTRSVRQELSEEEREEIEAVGRVAAGVILTTACAWAVRAHPAFSSDVIVMPKPYELDSLAENIRATWARARGRSLRRAWRHITRVAGAACVRRHAHRGSRRRHR